MAFSLGTILYVALLLTNAIAILSEERFLAKSAYHLSSVEELPFHVKLMALSLYDYHVQSVGRRTRLNRSPRPRMPDSGLSHRTTTIRMLDRRAW